ncbi:MAG: ABC transporter ATP-binding protein [Thermoanaerobaculia bacterium]|nr:ABC transporter ATP-binding protein [Thermoanaerobaculia bacterium]
MHWALKLPLLLAITLAVLTASYVGLVRSTVVGEVLNGRRRTRTRAASAGVPAASPHPVDGPVAALHGASKRYGEVRALERLDLAVRPGDVVALLGPNGAGKSTAVGLWLGLVSPDAGEVRLMGGSPDEAGRRLGVGVMLQDVALTPTLTAREHVALASCGYADPTPADEVIAKAGIAAFADQRYGRLSGGQKRQVQFAVAICGRPRLLFLDEPTVGLDGPARETLWRTVRALVAGGCAVVLTTHYLEEAEALADRVAVIAGGRLVAEGTVPAMRAVVARRRIRCASDLHLEQVRRWPGVVDAVREQRHLRLTASSAEEVVRRLLDADPGLSELEVERASLAEALSELTREAA